LSLLQAAFDRFADNSHQPPNTEWRLWLKKAQAVIANATEEGVQ
jgi:hypothetical protein